MSEKNRGRHEVRITRIYARPDNLAKGWETVETIIKVYRKVNRHNDKKPQIETAYFISSVSYTRTAKAFHEGIRGHWLIENALHYVKDVTFNEDASKIRSGNAPQNMSLMKNFVINLLRAHGYNNLRQAMRTIAHDINAIVKLMNR